MQLEGIGACNFVDHFGCWLLGKRRKRKQEAKDRNNKQLFLHGFSGVQFLGELLDHDIAECDAVIMAKKTNVACCIE